MNNKLHAFKYVASDILAASFTWCLFFIFRKLYIEPKILGKIPFVPDNNFYLGLIFLPLFWLLLYYLSGYYKDIYRKSRLKELGQTFLITIIGVMVIFFVFILDDTISSYKDYYQLLIFLFTCHFVLTYIPRVLLTSSTVNKIQNRILGFNTLLVGSNGKALHLYKEFVEQPKSSGNKFVGFVNIHDKKNPELEKFIPHLGSFDKLEEIIIDNQISEVIIAIESSEHEEIGSILNKLQLTNVIIKVTPSMYDIITGVADISALYGAPLIEIPNYLITAFQDNVKRLIDVTVSFIAILLLTPLYIGTALAVKFTSQGPVFFSQVRVGKNRKPFKILKYRSMYVNAEVNGPELSSKDDSRITKIGKFMRKTRLDEIPQFFNVLKGDMSLVGPRPERQFYIDQIVQNAPHYLRLHKVKPGITSWGQVKFGYAENVEEMIERLKYDIIYLENMSVYVDIKILIYTIKIVLQGTGK
jgi:exopolysaccharide biosynthesis polyprenyl glycosylphosphotransferase